MPSSRLIVFVVALLVSVSGFADQPKYPPAVQNAVNQGVKIIGQFDAPAGMTGFVGKSRGQDFVFYATPDGQYVIVGHMYDAAGNNLTGAQLRKFSGVQDPEVAWKKLESAAWIAEGADKPKTVIYEFTDPNCPFCHLFWLANQPYMKAGLQVRHIIVGFLSKESKLKAAAILASKDPAAAYEKNEREYRSGVPESHAGGIPIPEHPDPDALKQVEANTNLMEELGVNGTPGVFYRDSHGKVQHFVGLPSLSKLPGIYGLPAQPVTDPRLKRYE